jgi:hypothetical protein
MKMDTSLLKGGFVIRAGSDEIRSWAGKEELRRHERNGLVDEGVYVDELEGTRA